MNYSVSKYNMVTDENLTQFEAREVLFHETGASNSETNNAVLTLENIVEFYNLFEAMKERLKNTTLKNQSLEHLCTLVFKFIQNFLNTHKQIKEVEYIRTKVLLSDLIEASIIFTKELKEQ